jgi:hypothetical protein
VQITGRAERLVTPSAMQSRWRRMRLYLLGPAIIILAVILIWAMKNVTVKVK